MRRVVRSCQSSREMVQIYNVSRRTFIGGMIIGGLLLSPVSNGTVFAESISTTSERSHRQRFTANVASGKVVDSNGQPLKGAFINFSTGPSSQGGHAQEIQTDENGAYSQELAPDTYTVTGFARLDFMNQQWNFPLYPDNGQDGEMFYSPDGIVKNFTWKLSGPHPGFEGKNQTEVYGASIFLNLTPTVPAGTTYTFTLTPNGPLVDGSQGKPLTIQKTQKEQPLSFISPSVDPFEGGDYLIDIPLGPYTISAQAKDPDGNVVPVAFQSTSVTFTPGPYVGNLSVGGDVGTATASLWAGQDAINSCQSQGECSSQ